MAKCPKCGVEVVNPAKSWSMIGKPNRSGEMFKLTIGLYNCVCSDKSFRSVIGKEKITLNGVLEKNNSLEEQLMEATSKKTELECAIKALEEEKNQLLAEVEALRAIPMLEERVSSLEDDIAKLREEKGALMNRLTTLVADAPPIIPPPQVEKPLEDYISETVNDEAPSTIEEHIQESPSPEINVNQTEEPTINVVPTVTPEQENLPVETIAAEPSVELPAVEATPVTDIPEDPAIKISCEADTPSTDQVVETPVETIAANIPLAETSPPVEKSIIDEVIATPPMEVTSAEVKQVETPTIEQKVATEAVETTSMDNTKEEVPISEPQGITPAIEEQPREAPQEPETVLVEASQAAPATLQTNIEPIELAPVLPEETQRTREELLVEVKPLEDILVEANPIQNPTPPEIAEISPPVTLVDTPSIEETQSADTLIEAVKNDIASAEKLCQEISEIAKEIDEVKPSEDITSTSTPPNLTEPVQVIPIETTQPEIQITAEEKTPDIPVIEPPTLDIPKIEEATTNIATPSVEEIITATPLVNEKLSEEKPSEATTKPAEEKQPGFVV